MDKELKEGELADILKIGTEELFSNNLAEEVHYSEEELEKMLDRSKIQPSSVVEGQDKYLGALKDARIWENENTTAEKSTNDPNIENFWSRILAHKMEETKKEEENLGKGITRCTALASYLLLRSSYP